MPDFSGTSGTGQQNQEPFRDKALAPFDHHVNRWRRGPSALGLHRLSLLGRSHHRNEPTRAPKRTAVDGVFVERLHTSQAIFQVVFASETLEDDADGEECHQLSHHLPERALVARVHASTLARDASPPTHP